MNKDNKVIIKRINDWLECYQNKDNGFYNATALLKQYNEHYPEKPKKMIEFLRLENTQKYIGCVLSDGKAQRGNSPLGCKNTKKTKPNIFGMVENQDNSFPNIFGKIDNEKDTLFYVKKGRKSKNTQVSDYQVCDNSPTPDNQQVTEITDTLLYMKKGRTLKKWYSNTEYLLFRTDVVFKVWHLVKSRIGKRHTQSVMEQCS